MTALGVAYVPSGKHHLKVGGPFFVGFSHVVLTPLAEDHPAVAPFTAKTEELAAAVDRVNGKLANTEKLRRFIIAREPFSTENEMMTPTMKIRRHKVLEVYREDLEGLYEKK